MLTCRDSAIVLARGAEATLTAQVYARTAPPPNSGKLFVSLMTRSTAPGAPVLRAIGIGGLPNGVVLPGWGCYPLFVDPSRPTLYLSGTASSLGNLLSRFGPATHTPPMVGIELWGQAAWDDSRTRRPSLTIASRLAIPRLPQALPKALVYSTDPRAATGVGPSTDGFRQQLPRLAK